MSRLIGARIFQGYRGVSLAKFHSWPLKSPYAIAWPFKQDTQLTNASHTIGEDGEPAHFEPIWNGQESQSFPTQTRLRSDVLSAAGKEWVVASSALSLEEDTGAGYQAVDLEDAGI